MTYTSPLLRKLSATAMASALMLGSFALAAPDTQLLRQADSFPVLNAQNFDPAKTYVIPTATDAQSQVKLDYKGYVFGLRIMRASVVAQYGDPEQNAPYAAYADIRTSGLAAILKTMEIWSVTSGRMSPSQLKPDWHVQQNTDKKNRRVEMAYDRNTAKVDVNIVPPLGSQGLPPASPAERFSANDTLSGILTLMLKGSVMDGELCTGSVPMFDSKQRYNLRLERVGEKRVKFLGDKENTVHCHIYYEPIAGFDPEDLPSAEEEATPVDAYFQWNEDLGTYLPVRMTYKVSGFKAVIKLDELEVVAPK